MTKAKRWIPPASGGKTKGQLASAAEKTALLDLFKRGRPAESEQSARAMMRRYPQEAFAWKVLGVALKQQGKLEEAMKTLARATVLTPTDAEAWNNLGDAQELAGQLKAAEASFRRAVAIAPENHALLCNLGGNLKNQGQFEEAEQLARRALALEPDYPIAHCNHGAVLKDMGRLAEAEAATRQALALKPDYVNALMNLGAIQQEQGRLREALESTEKVLTYEPENFTALQNICVIHHDLKQWQAGVTAVRRMLAIKPESATAWCQLSIFQRHLGEDAEADQALGKAIALEPENAAFRLRNVIACLPLAPDTTTEADKAATEFLRRAEALATWVSGSTARREALAGEVGIMQPFYLAYRQGNHREALSCYGDALTLPFAAENALPLATPARAGKIRLLIVSAYIRRHSVWDIVLKGIVRHLDRTRFEIYIYSLGKLTDEETRWARAQADGWRDASAAFRKENWLDWVRRDAPDVIYYPEIGMDPITVFLAAHRLAPLQVVGWGHPITSGLPTMDCYLSGELIEGPAAAAHYREQLVRLPGAGCCTQVIDIAPQPAAELMASLAPLPRPWFVIPQRFFKFDPADDDLYAEIAARVGECSFLIPEENENRWGALRVQARIGRAFAARGLDPERFLKRFPQLERGQFYTLLDKSDVFLDCPGFSGYTTAWQAAHRGLPIVTLEGEFMRQRLAAGLLRQIGQTETIAPDRQAYVDIAVRLGQASRNTAQYAQRRAALQAAAAGADRRIEVVHAFEQTLIDQLNARQALPRGFTNTPSPPKETPAVPPAYDYPWQQLDADLHFHSLRHDYAPVGLLQMISDPPRQVLDVGCFCGGSGRWLKNQFPGTHVTGIEMLAKAAAVAREIYDEVHVGKFEEIDLTPWQGKFDAIIVADVLEHMYNPWAVLQKLSPLLAPGGALYISLPNIRNLNILMGLAGGEWRYAGAGILDITHIRFFTKQQILEMLQQTGWQAHEVKLNFDQRLTPSFKGVDLNTLKNINAGKLKLENLTRDDVFELLTLQFFIRATPVNTLGVTV